MISMNEALNLAWADIRRHHRKVPKAIVVVGRERTCGTINWADPVIYVGAETFASGEPGAILHALLHQAAHGLGGTSKASHGAYHDRAFQAAAEALGLGMVPGVLEGWHASTVLPDETAGRYGESLGRLQQALVDDKPALGTALSGRNGSNGIVAVCTCHPARKIRIRGEKAAQELAEHPIRCETCDTRFVPEGRS
jgi:hypothetical protein